MFLITEVTHQALNLVQMMDGFAAWLFLNLITCSFVLMKESGSMEIYITLIQEHKTNRIVALWMNSSISSPAS